MASGSNVWKKGYDISTIHWDGTKRQILVVEEANESCLGHTTRQLNRDVHSASWLYRSGVLQRETWKYMNKFVSHKQMIDN